MIFNFLFRSNSTGTDSATRVYSVGDHIVGLRLRGESPQSVTLTYHELRELLHHPEYTVNHVLLALYKVEPSKGILREVTE